MVKYASLLSTVIKESGCVHKATPFITMMTEETTVRMVYYQQTFFSFLFVIMRSGIANWMVDLHFVVSHSFSHVILVATS
jgi:hypothetical protein